MILINCLCKIQTKNTLKKKHLSLYTVDPVNNEMIPFSFKQMANPVVF